MTQVFQSDPSTISSSIGRYRILDKLGEGGMGSVLLAEQREPVVRRVAVKIIKSGMDSAEVIARFEAERQALSLMDHPNIAKVFDAGTTDSGQPYFVMELVKGSPLNRYCQDNNLSLDQRLALFAAICNGVHHAHQKGVIHRDLKPSNILVADYDGEPVPKIIDFGLAKAIGQNLTDKTLVTQFGQVVGTIAYMSPEQSKLNQLDIDTRTDIFSLGVILYELLTGTTPIDSDRLQSHALDQLLKLIREEDPPVPSQRLSTVHTAAGSMTSKSGEATYSPARIRGELDWIVMKSLDKDRARRYETAHEFSLDVKRFLQGEPVEAAPATFTYRLKKLISRNRGFVVAASVVLFVLVCGIIGTSYGLVRANTALVAANESAAAAEAGRLQTRKALDMMSGTMLEEWLLKSNEITEQQKAFLNEMLAIYDDFAQAASHSESGDNLVAMAWLRTGAIQEKLGNADDALQRFQRAIALFESAAEKDGELRYRLAKAWSSVASIHQTLGELGLARKELVQTRISLGQLCDEYPDRLEYQNLRIFVNLQYMRLQHDMGNMNERDVARMALLHDLNRLADQFPDNEYADLIHAQVLSHWGRKYHYSTTEEGARKGADLYLESIEILDGLCRKTPTNDQYWFHLSIAQNDLGVLYKSVGERDKAIEFYLESNATRKRLREMYPNSVSYATLLAGNYLNLGNVYRIKSSFAEALKNYQEGIDLCNWVVERNQSDRLTRRFLRNLFEGIAETHVAKKEFQLAKINFEKALENVADKYAADRARIRISLRRARVLVELGQSAEALEIVNGLVINAGRLQATTSYHAVPVLVALASQANDTGERQSHLDRAAELLRTAVKGKVTSSSTKGLGWRQDPEYQMLIDHPLLGEF